MLIVLKVVWVLVVVTFAVILSAWPGSMIPSWLELLLPPLMLALSFVVFHGAARPIRLIHHWLVSLALLGGAAFICWVFLFPKEQSGVGVYFLAIFMGAGYLILLALLAIGLFSQRLFAAFRDRGRASVA